MKIVKWIVGGAGFIILFLALNFIIPQFISEKLQYRLADTLGIAGAENVGDMLISLTFIISLVLTILITALVVVTGRAKRN